MIGCNSSLFSNIISSYVNSQSPHSNWRNNKYRNNNNNNDKFDFKDIPQDNLKDISKDNSKVIPQDISNNISNDLNHNTSLISSIFVLIKSTIGTSIYILPYTFSKTGWIFGIIFLFCGCIVNIFSLYLLILCSNKVYPSSFYAITKKTFPHAVALIDLSIALDCLGTSIAYLVVIGGIMPQVMLQFNINNIFLERQFWITIAFLFCIPCGFIHHISAFKWTSAFADISVAFFCIILMLYSIPSSNLNPCDETNVCNGTTSYFSFSFDTLKVFSIYSMAFNCQMQLFPVINELKYPTTRREDLTISIALISTFILYLIVAVCGYSIYGDQVSDNILESYPNNFSTNLARVLVSVQLVLSYPLILIPGRESMVSFWLTISDVIENNYQHYLSNFMIFNNHSHINDDNNTKKTKINKKRINIEEVDDNNEFNDNIYDDNDNIILLTGNSSDNQIHNEKESEIKLKNQTMNHDINDIEMVIKEGTFNPLNSVRNDNQNEKIISSDNIKENTSLSQEDENIKDRRFNIATVFFLAFTFCIAISPVSLGLVSEIIGATGSVLTTFLLPGAIFIAMFRKESPESMGLSHTSYLFHMIGAYILLISGIIIGPVCLFALFF